MIPQFPLAIIPLYQDGEDALSHNATGTLLQYGLKRFLCTAAHALPKVPCAGHALLAGGPTPFNLNEFRVNKPPLHAPDANDILDLAITELNDYQISRCAGNSFLVLEPTTPWYSQEHCENLLACGYPSNRNPDDSERVSSNGLVFPLRSNAKFLVHDEPLKSHKNGFISGTFDPRDYVLDKNVRGYNDCHGMSGGALFYEEPNSPGNFSQLAGMIIEAHVTTRGTITFTAIRARSLIQFIHSWFEDTPRPQ